MEKKDRYIFPAILTYEDGYEIAVTFPDLPGCATSGADEDEALKMAKDVLGGTIWCMEQEEEEIPMPSRLQDLHIDSNECVVMVDVYMPVVRLAQENKSVNRTVTIPAWLNAVAVERGVNFSLMLQNALKDSLAL